MPLGKYFGGPGMIQGIMAAFGLAGFLMAQQAVAAGEPWSVTLYTGPWAPKYFGAALQDFNLQNREMIAGIALDRKLAYLGYDIYLSGELQATQTYAGHGDTTFAVGLGFECIKILGFERTSFAAYTGPSYGLNPSHISIGYKHRLYPAPRKKFLNAVTLEFASGLPFSEKWDWAARLYHRSGVFGLYSEGNDDGVGVGLGFKYHF